MNPFENLPSNKWGQGGLTNGEIRTLLKILLELDDDSSICDFVVIARVYDGDAVMVDDHSYDLPHRGLVSTSLDDDEFKPFLMEAIKQMDREDNEA